MCSGFFFQPQFLKELEAKQSIAVPTLATNSSTKTSSQYSNCFPSFVIPLFSAFAGSFLEKNYFQKVPLDALAVFNQESVRSRACALIS